MPFRLAAPMFRLLAICAALAAATGAAAQSAPAEPGVTTIDAENIEGVSDIEVTARGNAEIRRDDTVIFGDVLRYNRELGSAQGEGGVRMQSGADRFFGPRMQYNTLDNTGVFEQPTFLLQREREARGGAERLEFLGKDKFRFFGAHYTTCRPGQEDWVLTAKELELDFEAEEGHATSPRLRFFDVPILGAPAASFPLNNRRRSGLLAPYYSQTSQRGFEVGIPYYWNIAPEYDATFTPATMSRRGTQLKSQGRYLNQDFSGELRFEYLPDDKEFGTSREGVSFQHAHTFYPGLTGAIDYNRVSDDRYFVDLASQVRQVTIGNLPQDGYLAYSTAAGRVPLSAQIRVQSYQTLQDPLAPIVPPYHRVPQINFGASYNNLGNFLDSNLPLEYVQFTHPTLVEGSRSTVSPTFAAPFIRPGGFITPKLGVRHVSYDLTHNLTPGQAESPAVTIPWASLDGGLLFERPVMLFDQARVQTLEPRLFYVYVPYRNQDAIPIFDTALADLNYAQLFSENRFVGGDRFGDAKQVTFALTSRLLEQNGQERLRATIAQRHYFEDERVGLTPTSPLRTTSDSDLLMSIGGRPSRAWAFDVFTQWGQQQQRTERFAAAARYTPEAAKVINASYRFTRATENVAGVNQVDISAQWPVSAGWYAVGRYNYSILDGKLLDGLAGFERNAGCWVFRAVVQRVQAAQQVASTGIFFQFEFNGVGQIGTNDVVQLLQRNVAGYSVTNPRDDALRPPSLQQMLPFEQVY
ncbi:MAG TPA: LPS-assembly protein LptD [Burkholderiales bacterium]